MEDEKDKVISDVIDGDQSENKQSDEVKEVPSLEKVAELVKALQKGYTETRQEFAQTRESLEQIAASINAKTGAETGDDEYLTVGKLKTILAEQSYVQENTRKEADSYINNILTQLRAEGKIDSREEERVNKITGEKEKFNPDEEAFLTFALKHQMTDLIKAFEIYSDVKSAKEEAKKEGAKKAIKAEEGAKIGTSQKAGTSEQGGVDYRKVKNMDWFSF